MPEPLSYSGLKTIRIADLMAARTFQPVSLVPQPDDFCRTCRGSGRLYDQEYRQGVGTVSVAMDCWACDGSGWGK